MCGGTGSKRRVQNVAAGFGILTNASLRIFFVMRGLDPRIHRSARGSCEEDGLPGQARQ
jgi:hypothetical protein